jgi:acyl-CoA dehydrogenase
VNANLIDFLSTARAFLDANARRRDTTQVPWGEGPDTLDYFAQTTRDDELAAVRTAQQWQRTKFDAGFAWITGPPEFGGRALDATYELAYHQLEAEYETGGNDSLIGMIHLLAPTLLEHGSPETIDRYLVRLVRGDIVAVQLFSEPGAGSDIAGVQTRARREGAGWVINGQKVWSSNAQFGDIGLLVCRTNPDVPKHRGITVFLVDLASD